MPSWEGSATYKFSRHVVVTSDSARDKPLVFDTTGTEVFGHRMTGRSNTFTLAGPVPDKTAQATATLVSGQLVLSNQNDGSSGCAASANLLRSELSDLSSQVPATLSTQSTWTDSVMADACIGGVPGSTRTIRRFMVVGDTVVGGAPAVIVSRRDSANITADGVLEQHPTAIGGTAVSNTLLYLSESSGRLLRVSKEQVLVLSISAEGSTRMFVQKLTSASDLVR